MSRFKRTKKPIIKTPSPEFIWSGGILVRSLNYKGPPGEITPEESLEADRNIAFYMLKAFKYQPWMNHVLTQEEIENYGQ